MKLIFAASLISAAAAADQCSIDASSRYDCGQLASDQDSCEVRTRIL
jgi:hypothetical protein